MDKQAFKENLNLDVLPGVLDKLIDFQNDVSGFEYYAQGFGLTIDDKLGLKSWSEASEFLDKLLPFAQANGSGSFYAIWNNDSSQSIDNMPVVVFGDEGGTHVVAENILQLLQLIAYDTEISVEWNNAFFYKDEDDYEASEDLQKYIEWLKINFNTAPLQDPNATIQAAQDKYKASFDQWFKQYYNVE